MGLCIHKLLDQLKGDYEHSEEYKNLLRGFNDHFEVIEGAVSAKRHDQLKGMTEFLIVFHVSKDRFNLIYPPQIQCFSFLCTQ